MSRLKSLDRGREIHRDLKNSAFLDSLSLSRSRSARIFAFSRQDFSISRDFSSFSDSKGLDNVKISRQILLRLDKSRQSARVSTISTKISTRQYLDWKVLILKISIKKKKSGLHTKDSLDLDLNSSRLSRPPGLVISVTNSNNFLLFSARFSSVSFFFNFQLFSVRLG